MAAHTLKAVQNIPVPVNQAWNFFSNPANLPLITPASMSFRIVSRHHGDHLYPGQIIEYTVTPLAFFRFYWMTEITHVSEGRFFIDEQRYGPYAMWHHQHHFRAVEGGTEMTDLVHYRNPMGVLGRLADPLMVKPRLKKIFEYRFRRIGELFGSWPGQAVFLEVD